jgi:hypothetical protein
VNNYLVSDITSASPILLNEGLKYRTAQTIKNKYKIKKSGFAMEESFCINPKVFEKFDWLER